MIERADRQGSWLGRGTVFLVRRLVQQFEIRRLQLGAWTQTQDFTYQRLPFQLELEILVLQLGQPSVHGLQLPDREEEEEEGSPRETRIDKSFVPIT